MSTDTRASAFVGCVCCAVVIGGARPAPADEAVVFDRKAELPPDSREFNHWCPGYRPADGQACTLNPPKFSWMYYIRGKDRPLVGYSYYDPFGRSRRPHKTALMRFRFQVAADADFRRVVVDKKDLWYPWYNTIAPLKGSGPWYWRVGYSVAGAGPIEWDRTRSFALARGATVWDRSLLGDTRYLASKGIGPKKHPRYIFNWKNLPRFRKLLAARADLLAGPRMSADQAMKSTWWKAFPTDDDTGWKGGPYRQCAAGLTRVAMAHLLTGDAKYLTAKEKFLLMARWWDKAGKPGSTSPEYVGQGARGTNGRVARALAAGFDWLYDQWTPEQRALLVEKLTWRLKEQEAVSGCSSSVLNDRFGPGKLPFVIGSHGYEDHMDCIPAAIAVCDESQAAWESFESNVNYLLGVAVSGVGNPDDGFAAGLENYGLWHWTCYLKALGVYQVSFPEVGFGADPSLHDYARYFITCRPPGIRAASWGHYSAGYSSYAAYIGGELWNTGRITRQRIYRKWAGAFDRWSRSWEAPAEPRRRGGAGVVDAYLDMLKPWRDDMRPPDLTGGYAALFRNLGFVAVSSSAPYTREAMAEGVGMTFACHPAGRPSHGFFNEGTFDLRAYGELIATGGGNSKTWSPTGDTSLGHNCILFDGDGQGGRGLSGGGGVVQEITRTRWGWPGFPRVARIVAFQQQPGATYFCGDSSHAYCLEQVRRVRRHVVFVRGKYFVIFDEVRTSKPARITWLYHVDLPVPLTVLKEGVGFDYRMGKVAVRVRQVSATPDLECVNHQDEDWMTNPVNGSDVVLKDWKTRHPGGRLMKHNLWVTTRRAKTRQDFLTVIYPLKDGMPEPGIERLDDSTVKVTAGGDTDVIGFGPGTEHPTTILVRADQIGVKEDTPVWRN